MSDNTEERIARMIGVSSGTHASQDGRAALRCGLGDASGICDILVRQIENEHRGKRGVTKQGRELAAIAKRCADTIWRSRDLVARPSPSSEE